MWNVCSNCCRYKYILAYLPLVAFYYRGKTLLKFSLESSFEDLRDLIANITGKLGIIPYVALTSNSHNVMSYVFPIVM